MSCLFESDGQSIGGSASASILAKNGDFLIVYILRISVFIPLCLENIFYMICFMAQGVIYLDTWAVGKNVSCSILLVFYAEFFSAFADFLSSFSIGIERKVLLSLTQFWFCPFLFLVLLGFSLMCFVDPLYGAHIEVSCLIGGFSLLSLQWPFLSLVIFFAPKTIVSDNDNDLFWLIFKW